MSLLWTKRGCFRLTSYASEAALENAIEEVRVDLFGPQRLYLRVKKKIGGKGK